MSNFVVMDKDSDLESISSVKVSSFIDLDEPQVKVIYFRDLKDMKKPQEHKSDVKPRTTVTQSCSKAPVVCPIEKCGRPLRSREILSHAVIDHKVLVFSTGEHVKTYLSVNEQDLEFNRTTFLGVLAYNGPCKSQSFISGANSNVSLPSKYKMYSSHLPILVLGRRTNIVDLFNQHCNLESCSSLQTPVERNPRNDVVLIWLATSPSGAFLYAELTATSATNPFSYGVTVKTRILETVEEASDQIKEDHCLRLNHGCLQRLTSSFKNSFNLEVCLFSNDLSQKA